MIQICSLAAFSLTPIHLIQVTQSLFVFPLKKEAGVHVRAASPSLVEAGVALGAPFGQTAIIARRPVPWPRERGKGNSRQIQRVRNEICENLKEQKWNAGSHC